MWRAIYDKWQKTRNGLIPEGTPFSEFARGTRRGEVLWEWMHPCVGTPLELLPQERTVFPQQRRGPMVGKLVYHPWGCQWENTV